MIIANTRRELRTTAVVLLAVLAVASCGGDSGGSSEPDIKGNYSGPDGQAGSNPRTSLTFSQTDDGAGDGHSSPGQSALASTLAAPANDTLSFDELQVLVFGPMCSGCHAGGGSAQPYVFDFTTADASFATLVNQPSTAVAGATLVAPGRSADSYLMQTLDGSQVVGARMPMRTAPVSDELLNAIQSWIDNGASR